jgi:hypothetical protein
MIPDLLQLTLKKLCLLISAPPVGPLPSLWEGFLHSNFKTKSLASRENDEGIGGSLFVIRLDKNIKNTELWKR